MRIIKTGFIGITIAASFTLSACNSGSQQIEHSDYDHHDEMESEKGHDHSTIEEHHDEIDNEAEMHREHESIRGNFAHKDIIILDSPYQAGPTTDKELQDVVNAYLAMKNAFVNDDAAGADRAAADMAKKVKAVDRQPLKGEGEKAWKQHASLYTDKLAELQHVHGLEEKRSYLGHISEIVYCTVKSFRFKRRNGALCRLLSDGF